MLDLGSGVASGARGWVAGRAGLWGVPPTWVWVVGFSPQTLEHPSSIFNTGVNHTFQYGIILILLLTEIILIFQTITKITAYSHKSVYRMTSTADNKPSNLIDNRYKLFIIHSSFPFRKSRKNLLLLCHTTDMTRRGLEGKKVQV